MLWPADYFGSCSAPQLDQLSLKGTTVFSTLTSCSLPLGKRKGRALWLLLTGQRSKGHRTDPQARLLVREDPPGPTAYLYIPPSTASLPPPHLQISKPVHWDQANAKQIFCQTPPPSQKNSSSLKMIYFLLGSSVSSQEQL